MSDAGLAPRRAAVRLLTAVIDEGRQLSELTGGLDKLAPADRARAQRLATETLRHLDRADRVLKPFLKKTPPLAVQNVLRLSVVEMAEMGAASHGVVNDAVSIVAANKRTQGMKGLVNAVLRKVDGAGFDKWHSLPLARLPKWLRSPLSEAYGEKTIVAMERAHGRGAPLDLTAKSDPDAVAKAVAGTVLPTGSVRVPEAGQVSTLPGFETGDWWVQDAAAALPVRILAPQKGERILDMCAAPGGKTMQIAASGADTVSLDVSDKRMERVAENLSRTGLKAEITVADALEYEGGPFDAIVLDAPCSATGTLRRHPDLPYAKDGSAIAGLIELQGYLLDRALGLLKPGGRLVFCTCSLLPDEGECQIDWALERHPDLHVDRDAVLVQGVDPAWQSSEGGLRLRPDYWPEHGGMDGFFIAMLRKST